MMTELALAIGIIIGLAVGLLIDRNARHERDDKIASLEKELTMKQNVAESLNATVQRLRNKLKKKGYEADDRDN